MLRTQVAEEVIYSLNKTSTRDFILKKAKSFGFEGEVLAEMRVSPGLAEWRCHLCVRTATDSATPTRSCSMTCPRRWRFTRRPH